MMGMMGLMWLVWALVIVGLAAGVYWLLKRRRSAPVPDSPQDTLDRRYAAGEITTEEYEERKRHIDHRPPTPDRL